MKRWTIKELDVMSDGEFIAAVLDERLSTLTNPYTPLARRLKKVSDRLKSQDGPEFDLSVFKLLGDRGNADLYTVSAGRRPVAVKVPLDETVLAIRRELASRLTSDR